MFPARYHIAHLARDNPDCGTYKGGYRVARKIILIADIMWSESALRDRYRAIHPDPTRTTTMAVLLSTRNQSTSLPVIGSRYAFTVQASPKPAAAPSTVLSKAARTAPRDRGSCSCRRGQGRLPRRRRAPFSKERTRRGPDKGQHGFSSSEYDDESGKEVSIRRAGLNNSTKGPSLGPLTRECNLLAPARCTPRAHRDSLPHSLPVVHTRSWWLGLWVLFILLRLV